MSGLLEYSGELSSISNHRHFSHNHLPPSLLHTPQRVNRHSSPSVVRSSMEQTPAPAPAPSEESSKPNLTPKCTLSTVVSKSGYRFPSIYSFPPFFTKQPNPQTWAHQAELWQELIISYCRFHRMFKFELGSASQTLELFNNAIISRKLSVETIRSIANLMVNSGSAEYDPPRTSTSQSSPIYVFVYFHPLSHWSSLIYNHVLSHGLTNSVMTLHELSSHEVGPELEGLDAYVLRKALGVLVRQGKAKMLKGTLDGVGGEADGVKFF